MNYIVKVVAVCVLLPLLSCTPKHWVVGSSSAVKIAMDSTQDVTADTVFNALLQPYKQQIDAQMNEVIGVAAVTMRASAPESLLSNLNADIYRKVGSDFYGHKVDIGIVNLGGLRTVITEGNIQVRHIYELMPFDNELVIVWIKGDKLRTLIERFASIGGQGVSGIRFVIDTGVAEQISVNNQPIDDTKLYSIATNDYLANGNDKMPELAENVRTLNTHLKIRDILINYIKAETKKGNKITAELDGRIRLKEQ